MTRPPESVIARFSLPSFVSFIAGERLVRSRNDFLIAFLLATVELGGRPSVNEISQHVLPTVPEAVGRALLRSMENLGLLAVVHDEVGITEAGLLALTTEKVPQQDPGLWRIVWVSYRGHSTVLSCEREATRQGVIQQIQKERRNDESIAPSKKRRLPQGFFRSWHRPLLQADCDISFPSTQLEVPGVAGDQQVLMSVHYKAESAHLQVTYNDQTLEADVNDPLTELLQEHVLQALNDLDMSIDLDDLPANEILSLSFSGAIEDKCVLNDGVQRTHISWTGKRYDDERLDTRSWLAHYVSCSLNEVMTSSALSGHIADGRELLEREVNMDHTELLNLVLEVTEKRFGKYSDKWWHAQSGRDWGLM